MAPFFQLSNLGLSASPSLLIQNWLAQIQAIYPAYQPSSGNLEYIIAQIFASQAADIAQLCSNGGDELFRTFGTKLLNLQYMQGSSASAIIGVTAVDSVGYTLPSGTQLTLVLNGAPIPFLTTNDLVIPPGSTGGTVPVVAVAQGSITNGAGAPASLVSQINWVGSIVAETVASGGQDAEDDAHYLARLVQTLQVLAPRPITASDYATIAQNFTPALTSDQEDVGRATAIDGYDPNTETYGNERQCTVCVTDASGNPLNTDTLTAIQAWLESLREVNFIVNVVSPNYSQVYVVCQVHPQTGWIPASVQQNVQTALLNFLQPSNWGLPTTTAARIASWTNYQTIYASKILAVVQDTAGVDFVENLAIDRASNPTNSNDVTLPGPFPLPVSDATSIPISQIQLI